MISYEDALQCVLANVRPLGTEEVGVEDACGRTPAEDVVSPEDIPCYDNSAMDGYAVIAADLAAASQEKPVALQLCEDVPAGKVPQKTVTPGFTARIMTGAPIPKGADAVVMVETTEADGNTVRFFQAVAPGDHIRLAGEDMKKGSVALRAGHKIRAQEMGLLVSIGRARLKVFRRPQVGILSTGDEIIECNEPLSVGKVRNSNAYTLSGLVLKYGGTPVRLGIARDTREALREKLVEGLKYDMILTTGGVSVGDYDYVKDALADLRWELKFWQVATKPGKPVTFGLLSGKPVFGLPGNPSGAMVTFELFARPALLRMQGQERLAKVTVKARLGSDLRRKPGRMEFIPALVTQRNGQFCAVRCGGRGSGVLSPLCEANALIVVPREAGPLKKGDWGEAQLLDAEEMSTHDV